MYKPERQNEVEMVKKVVVVIEADEETPIFTFCIAVSSSEVVRRHFFSTRSKIQI